MIWKWLQTLLFTVTEVHPPALSKVPSLWNHLSPEPQIHLVHVRYKAEPTRKLSGWVVLLGVCVGGKYWWIAVEKIGAPQPESVGSPTTMIRNEPHQWELPIASHFLSQNLAISDCWGTLNWECYPLRKISMTEMEVITHLCLKL